MKKHNELIQVKKLMEDTQEEIRQCDEELSGWGYNYIIRTALLNYRSELRERVEMFDNQLIDALKKEKGIS
jgi:hypothetical protein